MMPNESVYGSTVHLKRITPKAVASNKCRITVRVSHGRDASVFLQSSYSSSAVRQQPPVPNSAPGNPGVLGASASDAIQAFLASPL